MKVKIIYLDNLVWYKIGDIYDVKPYRYNPDFYWEIEGWNGEFFSKSNLNNFYIYKKHSTIIDDDEIKIDNLFELKKDGEK